MKHGSESEARRIGRNSAEALDVTPGIPFHPAMDDLLCHCSKTRQEFLNENSPIRIHWIRLVDESFPRVLREIVKNRLTAHFRADTVYVGTKQVTVEVIYRVSLIR